MIARRVTTRARSASSWHTPASVPVELIPIIRKRITHSLHAPSTWSVSLHSPHSPNSRYPLTRAAHTLLAHATLAKPSSSSVPFLLVSSSLLATFDIAAATCHQSFTWRGTCSPRCTSLTCATTSTALYAECLYYGAREHARQSGRVKKMRQPRLEN